MLSGELLRILRDIDACTSDIILDMEPVGTIQIPLKLLRELKAVLRAGTESPT